MHLNGALSANIHAHTVEMFILLQHEYFIGAFFLKHFCSLNQFSVMLLCVAAVQRMEVLFIFRILFALHSIIESGIQICAAGQQNHHISGTWSVVRVSNCERVAHRHLEYTVTSTAMRLLIAQCTCTCSFFQFFCFELHILYLFCRIFSRFFSQTCWRYIESFFSFLEIRI